MIIEPTPTNPRSPLRRVLRAGRPRAAGRAAGRRRRRGRARPAAGAAAAQPRRRSPTLPDATPPRRVRGRDPKPRDRGHRGRPGAPGRVRGPARGPTSVEALAARAGVAAGAVVAVSGFLRVEARPTAAARTSPPGSLGPWCERLRDPRRVVADVHELVDLPHPVAPAPPAPPAPRHPGRRAAPAGGRGRGAGARGWRRPGPGDRPVRACRRRMLRRAVRVRRVFVVERFAWADGVRVGLTPLIADPLQTGTKRASPFGTVLGDAELPLAAVLTWPDGIARLDPDAAALAAAGPPSEPVWYVRVLEDAADAGWRTTRPLDAPRGSRLPRDRVRPGAGHDRGRRRARARDDRPAGLHEPAVDRSGARCGSSA